MGEEQTGAVGVQRLQLRAQVSASTVSQGWGGSGDLASAVRCRVPKQQKGPQCDG